MATQAVIPGGRMSHGPNAAVGSASSPNLYIEPDALRPTEYTVYLHSIAKRDFNQHNGVFGNIHVPACPKDKRYITFMRINHPVQTPEIDPNDTKRTLIRVENAKRLALSICNPDLMGNDLAMQDTIIRPENQLSSGNCNLIKQGIFASMNEVPTETELKTAEKRRIDYYRFLFEEANGLERSNPRELQNILTQDHHMAAEVFQVDVNWHRVVTPKIDCPNCGEKIKESAAFHMTNGVLCVLDWEKAWLSGAVKKDDVPEPKRWKGFSKP